MTYSMTNILDSLLEDIYTSTPRTYQKTYSPSVNVDEDNNQYSITMIATGLDIDNFTITYEDKKVTIAYKEVKQEKEDINNTHTSIHKEFVINKDFTRTVSLTKPVQTSEISAKLQKGLLSITLPKKEKVEAVTISVKE